MSSKGHAFRSLRLVVAGLLSICWLYSCNESLEPPVHPAHLHLTAGDPWYATYAAAMERSSFTADEGYALQYWDPDQPLAWTTDTGGDIALGFRLPQKDCFRLGDLFQAPVITASFPDKVDLFFYPQPGLRAEVRFWVYSSQTALWDIVLINESADTLTGDLVAWIRNDYRAFREVERWNEQGFYFQHEEYPDSWTINQGLPHADTLENLFVLDDLADRLGVFNSWAGAPVRPAFDVLTGQAPQFELNGRTLAPTGERILDPLRLQLFLDRDQEHLLTEHTPVRELPQPAVDQFGYRRSELGWLPGATAGTPFTLRCYRSATGQGATLRDTLADFRNGRKRVDIRLGTPGFLPPPASLTWKQVMGKRVLRWASVPGATGYRVFRRDYPSAVYRQVGRTEDNEWAPVLPGEGEAGWIVAAEDATGQLGMHSEERLSVQAYRFPDGGTDDLAAGAVCHPRVLTLEKTWALPPGGERSFRLVRTLAEAGAGLSRLQRNLEGAQFLGQETATAENEALYAGVPPLAGADRDLQLLYWSAFNMMRQMFYPPEGASSYNYYVFSREPTWGWGHGGQVFHESLTMPAYALLDPESALNSQRVYRERQHPNGYINYRTGAYLDEIIEYEGELTSSAPWYCWINWELYRMTRDTLFLEELYPSSKRFYEFYTGNRDKDGDGLCEWGGHAVLESVRDASVAIWDEVGWPANFEAVDLNSMLVMEAKALEGMARELELTADAERWKQDHEQRAGLIEATFWDETTGFYYHADRKDNDFTFREKDDLKRREVIGFLPLWAGVAAPERARRVIGEHLLDPEQFWRAYGVPTLAADDPYYNDKGYWNGPVWVEWNLLVQQALLNYGYEKEARELTERVAAGMIAQLKHNHNLWEFYSPDTTWAGYHKPYIWAGVINQMLRQTNK